MERTTDDWSTRERSACGIGLIANLKGDRPRPVLDMALEALANLSHRGALGADGTTTDGTGVMTQIPRRLLRGERHELDDVDDDRLAVACLFLPPANHVEHDRARRLVEDHFEASDLRILAWRRVPVDPSALGYLALSTLPEIVHVALERPDTVEAGDDFERHLYLARRRLENAARHQGLDEVAVVSCSSRTLIYKSMAEASKLPDFYPDLRHPAYRTHFALFHQRFSTNTLPTWRLAQPFRLLAHNGEINTLQGNYHWMRTREPQLESELWGDELRELLPVLERADSDSAMLDKVLELLIRSGRGPEHALSMLLPPARRGLLDDEDAVRAFFEYHNLMIEPWDGPAAVVACDGQVAVAAMDRNGLRPLRTWETEDGLLIVSSEAGVVSLPPEHVTRKGRLGPGEMLAVDLATGLIRNDSEIKADLAAQKPYRRWLDDYLQRPEPGAGAEAAGRAAVDDDRRRVLQLAFGYSTEALDRILEPMANGKLPIGSMGNDAPLALLSEQPQLLFSYFKQRFAQVTNPPIDPLREELVFDLETVAGGVANLLAENAPEAARVARFPSPVLSREQFHWLLGLEDDAFRHARLDLTWESGPEDASRQVQGERLRKAVDALADRAAELAAGDGPRATVLVLSDADLAPGRPTIPMLLAVAAVHTRLVATQRRMTVALVCETAEPREDHHVACLLGFGATLVYPYLAYDTVAARAEDFGLPASDAIANYRQALDKGLLKILSRLGVCPMVSYHGAQLFEALGLETELVDRYFPGTPRRLGGAGFHHLAEDILAQHRRAFEVGPLPDRGLFRFRRGGEHHDLQPRAFGALHRAVRRGDQASFDTYTEYLDCGPPSRIRHLLDWRPLGPSVPVEEVEDVGSITRRFATAAMSLGSLSKEAHETLAIAMNRIGGRSNSGEGGEDTARIEPYSEESAPTFRGRWQPGEGDWAASAIRQVASGRFGVTAHYLSTARQIEIKMAQGSKPGEGGQIPGFKVTPEIARLRGSTPGVSLISPPPHHDIYSIEDLAQLIYDLKQVNDRARVSVKLVSLAGVGTIACGVTKAHADIVLISGDDGGTGSSPLSSIKHAGLPWELGLAEAQQQLVANNLRRRITLRVDGGLRTGRDVVMAALLGAEEFGFGTAPLIALGCVMARQCHNDTCPVGIATQRENLRDRFPGDPEHLVRFFTFVAEQVRTALAAMGARRLDEIVGRFDLIGPRDVDLAHRLGLDFLDLWHDPDPSDLRPRRRRDVRNDPPPRDTLGARLLEDARRLVKVDDHGSLHYEITNRDRTVGARLAGWLAKETNGVGWPEGRLRADFRGVAGQSFGAFAVRGLDLRLVGDAQDGVGKGMSGGRIVLSPPPSETDGSRQVIAGNALLYGATGGELYVAGRVGERFCVRNSGATAVVEGCGDHGCEYMTGGLALILGPVGRNFGAGLTGGEAYVLDPDGELPGLLNTDTVRLERPAPQVADSLRELLLRHAELTGSSHARGLLQKWDETRRHLVAVVPRTTPAPLTQPNGQEAVTAVGATAA
ncbi:MAG: glutamate synthase large subunit [Acidobacteriota bacterium]